MMSVRVFSIAAVLAAASLTWVLPADAQSIRFREPAEFPPASFTGSQYVDSRGCIFMRAGIAGATTWVPRVTSSRENLCGAQPTFANGAPAQGQAQGRETAQAAQPSGGTVITAPAAASTNASTNAATAAAPARTAPAAPVTATARPPVQRPVAPVAQSPAPPPRATANVNARVAPQPPAMAARPGAPMPTIAGITTPPRMDRSAQPATRRAASAPVSAQANRCASDVRCGPQTQSPITFGNGTGRRVDAPVITLTRRTQAALDPQTRIVPRHVAQAQANAAGAGVVPPGYRPVWQDDRLNPRRAQGTVAGKAAMDLVWTQTVPRRLIDRRSGRDMTDFNPNLVYPNTDLAAQVRAGVPARNSASLSTSGGATASAPQREVSQPRISSRTAPPQPRKTATGGFVQVGAFADPANADRAIRRLQGAGLPVAVQNVSSKGKTVRVILAGPFANPSALSQGLGAARAAGFRDAFPRK